MLRYVEQWIQLSKYAMASQTRKRESPHSWLAPPVLRSPRKVKKCKQWSIDSVTAAVDAEVDQQALLTVVHVHVVQA